MHGRIFADTNILVYAFSKSTDGKKEIAIRILDDLQLTISTQVIREFIHVGTTKYRQSIDEILGDVGNITDAADIVVEDMSLIDKAIELHRQYKFGFYDCLIIAAALVSECNVLYSEDMQHRQVIEGTLTIVNPFL